MGVRVYFRRMRKVGKHTQPAGKSLNPMGNESPAVYNVTHAPIALSDHHKPKHIQQSPTLTKRQLIQKIRQALKVQPDIHG